MLPSLFKFPDALEDLSFHLFFEATLTLAGSAFVGEPGLKDCGSVLHLRADPAHHFCFAVREEAVVAEDASGGLAMSAIAYGIATVYGSAVIAATVVSVGTVSV